MKIKYTDLISAESQTQQKDFCIIAEFDNKIYHVRRTSNDRIYGISQSDMYPNKEDIILCVVKSKNSFDFDSAKAAVAYIEANGLEIDEEWENDEGGVEAVVIRPTSVQIFKIQITQTITKI